MSTNNILSKIHQEIEKRMNICDGIFERDSDTYYQGKAVAYQETLSLIDSLKQEQPCDTCTNDKGCVTCKDGELWEGKEQPVIKKSNALFDKCVENCDPAVMKEVSDNIDKILGRQPSEDLGAEMEKYFDGWNDDPEYGQAVLPHTYECVGVSDCKDIARHFYILGLKNNIPVTQITLDELVKEGEPINEDLEEAAEEYRRESYTKSVLPNIDGPMPEYGGSIKDTFIAGAKWQESQMLKDAVEKTVGQIERTMAGNIYFIHGFEVTELDFPFINSKECGYGDKVKIVIVPIKED